MEPPIVPGTGSAAAKSWTVYHPRHFSNPLIWNPDDAEHLPYGLHPHNERNRVISTINRRNVKENLATVAKIPQKASHEIESSSSVPSTNEINWLDIASIFQSVEVPRKSNRYKVAEPETPAAIAGAIFAPICDRIDGDLSSDEAESDTEEDLSEASTLAKHQIVLDSMKAKLDSYLEARKKQQERRKNKYIK